jgi:hypothetical protein
MEVEARIEPGSLRKVLRMSKEWDRVSKREFRKRLRSAATIGEEAARVQVLGPPPGGGLRTARSSGMRQSLAAGLRTSIQGGRETASGIKGEGVRIVTRSTRPDKDAMVKAYMAKQFRHPVFGYRDRWSTQRGKNWFYGPLFRHRDKYQRAVVEAIEQASRELGD